MKDSDFFSKRFVLRCPVWIIVDQESFAKQKGTSDTVLCYTGEPGLGYFLPIFMSIDAAVELARIRMRKGAGAYEVTNSKDLCRIIEITTAAVESTNVVVYLEKDKTRFYRPEDLLCELRSHESN